VTSLFLTARNDTLFLTSAPIFTFQSPNQKELKRQSLNNFKTTPSSTRINKNDSFELKTWRKTNAHQSQDTEFAQKKKIRSEGIC
jgi:hypothetical protein